MAKHVHTAEYNGFTFRRTSASRIYSHVVVGKHSRKADRFAAGRSARRVYNDNLPYYLDLANGVKTSSSTSQDQAQAWVSMGVEDYVTQQLAEFDARVAGRQVTEDGDTYYADYGWCSRLDLAQKAAAKVPNGAGFYVAATVVTK